MWRVGMWYGDEKTTTISYLRSGAVVFAAFIVTGTIYLSLQRSMDAVSKRISGTYTKGGNDEVGTSPTLAPSYPATGGPGSPFSPVNRPVNAYYPSSSARLPLTPTGSLPVAPPVTNIPVAYTIFTSDAERYQARAALADLRFAVKDFQDCESKGLPKSLAAGGAPGMASALVTNIDDASGADTEAIDRQTAETEKRRVVVDRVNGETEALNAMVSLTAHPDNFPASLQDPVGQVSRELRTYLQDVRYAAAATEERSRLLSLASQHLNQAEGILANMEQVTGTASGRNFP